MDALKTVLKMKGYLTGGNISVDNRSVTVNTMSNIEVDKLASVVSELKEMHAQRLKDKGAQTGRLADVEAIRPKDSSTVDEIIDVDTDSDET